LTAKNAPGDAVSMHLRGAVVDAKRAQIGKDARDDRLVRYPLSTEDLDAAIDDAPRRFRHDHLRATRLVQREFASVQDPGAVPDREARRMQVHLVVGEHEADPFVLADRLAECVTPPRVGDRDIVRAPCSAEPAHAMRKARRRQPHLRVLETLADLAQHVGRWDAQAFEADDAVSAGEAGVEAVHRTLEHDTGCVHVRQEHRRAGILGIRHHDRERGTLRAGNEPLAAVDHVVVAVAFRRRCEHRRVRDRPRRRFRHAKAGANRSGRERAQPPFLLRGRCDRFEQMHVPFVRRRDVQRDRAERRIAGFLEHDRACDVRQREAAVFARHVRR
jgi:hypothetical protein